MTFTAFSIYCTHFSIPSLSKKKKRFNLKVALFNCNISLTTFFAVHIYYMFFIYNLSLTTFFYVYNFFQLAPLLIGCIAHAVVCIADDVVFSQMKWHLVWHAASASFLRTVVNGFDRLTFWNDWMTGARIPKKWELCFFNEPEGEVTNPPCRRELGWEWWWWR